MKFAINWRRRSRIRRESASFCGILADIVYTWRGQRKCFPELSCPQAVSCCRSNVYVRQSDILKAPALMSIHTLTSLSRSHYHWTKRFRGLLFGRADASTALHDRCAPKERPPHGSLLVKSQSALYRFGSSLSGASCHEVKVATRLRAIRILCQRFTALQLLPRQRLCFFNRQQQHVVPTTDLPPYETMLRLDVRPSCIIPIDA